MNEPTPTPERPRRFFEGYSEARERVEHGDLACCLGVLDSLFGRENLEYGASLDDVRAEALRQLEREFTNPEWERTEKPYIEALVAAARRNGGFA